MGSIVTRGDGNWNKSLVKLPGDERWDTLKRYVISNGLTVDMNGVQIVFIDTINSWVSIVSSTAALRICQVMGIENATVNYSGSFDPYYSKVSKSCNANAVTHIPMSTCIGTERLTLEVDVLRYTIVFKCGPPLSIVRRPQIPDLVYSLCYQPADHVDLPMSYKFPGHGRTINYLSPLFPDPRDMLTYMWIIGNAALDPIARPRCLMLCGPGGSGKSTALRAATNALYGCTGLIPDNFLTRESDTVAEKVAGIVVKCRLATCYELDLDNKQINMSMFKNITGGDFVRVGHYMARSTCSFMIATNGLPNQRLQPEFASDAICRRTLLLRMLVDSASATYEAEPTGSANGVDFLCACLYVRYTFKDAPVSPMNVLLTLCHSKYFVAVKYIEECPIGSVNSIDGREVISLLANILETDSQRIVDKCRLISLSCVEMTPLGYIISGLRPLKRTVRAT